MSQNGFKVRDAFSHFTTENPQTANAGINPVLAVSPHEAARLCGIGRTTLYAALSSGELRSLKIGTRRLITLDALRDWLKRNETLTGE